MADYELQGEITTNTIDSEILSAPIIESEMMLGDTVVIDHYYNGLESDTVKITVDNDNNTIKADVNVGASVLDFAESEYNKSKNLFNENKYLISYCTYASNRWTTNSTRIGYNQSILTNETSATGKRNTSKLPLLKKGTYTLTIFNTVNNTNDTTINIALYNQNGTINGTFTTVTITTNTTITFTLASDLYLDIRVTGDEGTISFDHIQIEEGTVATDYQPYHGQITHNEDAPVVFADAERQKSKNLIPFPYYDGNSKTHNGITFTVNNNQSVSVTGSITNHDSNAVMYLAWDMPLKAGTYSIFNDSSNADISVVVWIADNYYSDEFTLSSDTTAKIYLQVSKVATQTFNTTVKFMLNEGGIDTDWQPYHGEIVHQGDITPVVLYDKNSANANINWGYTNGISTSIGLTLEDKDFNGYSRLKVLLYN